MVMGGRWAGGGVGRGHGRARSLPPLSLCLSLHTLTLGRSMRQGAWKPSAWIWAPSRMRPSNFQLVRSGEE